MKEKKPRRHQEREAPQLPSGYRQSRRGSGSLKATRKAERQHRFVTGASSLWRGFKNVVFVVVQGLAVVLVAAIVLLLVANAVNMYSRWDGQRRIAREGSPDAVAERNRENILVIGVDGDNAVGYIAMRVDRANGQVYGIAIPDGAFVDIPGLGFERIGEAFSAGPDVALATVSNFFTVPFTTYIVVPSTAYQDALTAMSVSALAEQATSSNLTTAELSELKQALGKVSGDDVAMVPMPVKPIKLGEQTYFEPQRDEVADLLASWWGVDATKAEQVTRVIVYNGAGSPGIAGEAAQQLIRAGLRVIDTKNADRFDYKETLITVRRGPAARGEAVRAALGVGEVVVDETSADVTDVIVVIGQDFKPESGEKGTQ